MDLGAGFDVTRTGFEPIECLGSGSMGTVWRVLDRASGVEVALKALRPASAEALHRFKNEFRVLQNLHHPNLIHMGELTELGGTWFYTMELVDGIDFLGFVAAGGAGGLRFDERRLRGALAQLAGALSAIHEARIVHRDVKPSNVLVTSGERVVLLDFGLVATPDADERDGGAIGTIHYMAPEQARGDAVGPAADVYAVGTMLYEALCGQLPFEGEPLEILVRKQDHAPEPPGRWAPALPADLEALCLDMLARRPESRPTAADVLRRLGEPVSVPRGDGLFIGREPELTRLLAWMRQEPRRPWSVIIEGESGVGKSALARRLAERVGRDHPEALVLSGRCYEREHVPFQGVDGVVGALVGHLAGNPDPTELLPDDLGALAVLFPDLLRLSVVSERVERSGAEPGDRGEVRRSAFAALRRWFAALAAVHPVVIMVDDAQWLDVDGRALLDDLMRAGDPPALLLLLLRRHGSGAVPAGTEIIQLAGLSAGDARALTDELMRRSGAAADRDGALARESRGHPLLLHELVRMAAEGADSQAGITLDDALAARLARLDPVARRLVDLVAVAGAPLPQRVLAAAAGLDFAEFSRQASALRADHVVRTDGARPDDPIEAYHDRIRAAALARLEPAEEMRLHGAIADALERSAAAVAPDRVMHHLAAAADHVRASRYAEEAAGRAMRKLAFARAADLFAAATELDAADPVRTRRLVLARADALVHAGYGAHAAELYLDAAEGGDPASRLECRRRAAEQLLLAGHIERGVEVLGDVLALAGAALPRTPRRALLSLAWQRAALRIRGLSWRSRDDDHIPAPELERLEVLKIVGKSLALVDNVRGADFQSRHLRQALRLGSDRLVTEALAMEAALLATQCDPRARKLAVRVQESADRLGHPVTQAYARIAAGVASFYMDCDWSACYRAVDAGEALLRRHAQTGGWETSTARLFKCFSLLHLGDLPELGRRVELYVREADQRGDRHAWVNLRARLGMPRLAAGDPEGARHQVDDAIAAWVPWREAYLVQHFFALLNHIDIALYVGDPGDLRATLAEQLPALRGSLLLRVWFARGEIEYAAGRLAVAEAQRQRSPGARRALLGEARRLARSLARNRAPAPRSWADLLAAGCAAVDGRAADAADRLRRALADLDAGGSGLYASAARRRLGQLVGGDEGTALVAEADTWLRARGVVDPATLAAALVIGQNRS